MKHFYSYYYRFFQKDLTLSKFGFTDLNDLVEIIKDTVVIKGECAHLQPQLDARTGIQSFVELTENHRRERTRRMNDGDSSVLLRFS